MSTTIRRRSKESGFRTPDPPRIPTLSEMIRDGQQSAAKIKRATKEALVEWFAQSERLNIARTHYLLRGGRFSDFARRIGIDRSSAYQLLKLSKHKAAILARCADEGRYYGWETCLYWFERNPDLSWHRSPHGSHTDEYATPIAIFERFGKGCNLDVCATAETAMSSSFYTKEQDGLKLPWRGRVWMNPPY